jgi:predicted nucleotidyltransferase
VTSPPNLSAAAKELERELRDEFGDQYLGLLLVGSRARGDFDDESDVDFELVTASGTVHERSFTRVDMRFEIVIRSERLLREMFAVDPYVRERLADSVAIGELDSRVEVLRRYAAAHRPLIRLEPNDIELFVWSRRIRGALDRARRANDILSRISNRSEAIRTALQMRFALSGRFVPRGRSIGKHLADLNPEEARLLEQFCARIAEKSAPEKFFENLLAQSGKQLVEYSYFYRR